jgi:hypothetical protein
MTKAIANHRAAILSGQVTKTNIIGIRKLFNAAEMRYLRREAPLPNESELWDLNDLLVEHCPCVVGEWLESGKVQLRNPRYKRRWNERQAAVIADIAEIRLIGYEQRGGNFFAQYRCVGGNGDSFDYMNVAWQSGGDGPEIIA